MFVDEADLVLQHHGFLTCMSVTFFQSKSNASLLLSISSVHTTMPATFCLSAAQIVLDFNVYLSAKVSFH